MNKKGFAVSGIIYSILVLFLILIFCILSLLGSRKMMLDKIKNDVLSKLNSSVEKKDLYKDTSGANVPYLMNNMIPIMHNGTNWIYADITQPWYDYTKQEWANAVILNEDVVKGVGDEITEDDIALWYVWIPRYKYTIFNGNNGSVSEQNINVVFETGTSSTGTVTCIDAINQTDDSGNLISEVCTDSVNGSIIDGRSTYTHPAFTYGDTELTGLWIGKFEVSTTDETCNTNHDSTSCNNILDVTIKPNVSSWTNSSVSNYFESIENISNTYNINGSSHMIKNMEWGAIAYLKQSHYGLSTTDIGINNYKVTNDNSTYTFMTGCGAEPGSEESTTCNAYNTEAGMLASTTGNIYGVYDMSGGIYEYTMGNRETANGEFYSSSSGFTTPLDSKFYDAYTYGTPSSTHARGKLGDATKETLKIFGNTSGGWNDDTATFPSEYSWFIRGGHAGHGANAGVFYFNGGLGDSRSYSGSRAVLIPVEGEYQDDSGANNPELLDNMIPIKYDGEKWIYADITKPWYDYDKQEWANGVVLNSDVTKYVGDEITEDDIALWYVWIPRYTYTIFNGNNEAVDEQIIDIKFETGTSSTGTVECIDAINTTNADGNRINISETCTDETNGSIINGTSTYTHPAFIFGDKELTGFWVGKFEVSGTIDKITIKPNVDSLRNTTVSSFFTAIQNIDTVYSTNGNNHMIKNMEWGAIAYLKQSKYGLGLTKMGINNYGISHGDNIYTLKTGCGAASESEESTTCNAYNTETGMLASTTGNVYGVYDMSGGAYEYTMSNMVNSSGEFYSSSAGFTTPPDSKYYDAYTYGIINTAYERGKLGDATKEVIKTFEDVNANNSWYGGMAGLPNFTSSWFLRGGIYTYGEIGVGVFFFVSSNGRDDSLNASRVVAFK